MNHSLNWIKNPSFHEKSSFPLLKKADVSVFVNKIVAWNALIISDCILFVDRYQYVWNFIFILDNQFHSFNYVWKLHQKIQDVDWIHTYLYWLKILKSFHENYSPTWIQDSCIKRLAYSSILIYLYIRVN